MKNIARVKLNKEGTIYYCHAADMELLKNDQVIVDTENGPVIGTVVADVGPIPSNLPPHLNDVIRKATEADLQTREENGKLEENAFRFCLEKIRERAFPMKLIDVECLFDRSKLIFSFTAENRVDFRELVKDLVQRFKLRIELRQIGARQEARIVKGLGICGREVCCVNLLHNLDRVSVKMAKEQSMSLNPEKISGLCGRLMCCLAYEYKGYLEMKKDMPKCGRIIQTAEGAGKVVRQNVLSGEISVELENGKEVCLPIKDLNQ